MLGGYFAPIETQLSDMTAWIKKTARKDTRPGGKTNRQTVPGQLAGHEEIPDPP